MKNAALLFAPVLTLAALAGPAGAAAPQPAKPVAAEFFSGRWYEIARSPNAKQRDCQAPTYDFTTRQSGDPLFVLTCRQKSPTGRAERLNARIRLAPGGANNRFRVSVLGGVVGADYLILDRADDLSWAILATTGGQDVWLLARNVGVGAEARRRAVERIADFGYDAGKLVYPRH